MKLEFIKYSANGNDFVVIDNRNEVVSASKNLGWSKLCHRKFGVGADGALLLEKSKNSDFRMRYMNADGHEVEMCGNGAMAITHFAHYELKIKESTHYTFETKNGRYKSEVTGSNTVKLQMTEIYDIGLVNLNAFSKYKKSLYVNTGVPHSVFQVADVDKVDVQHEGREVRYSKLFMNGCNANFFQVTGEGKIKLRTYERGVEAETLACGTGAVAAMVATAGLLNWKEKVEVQMPGGLYQIYFDPTFKQVYLCGNAEKIFTGTIDSTTFESTC